MFYRPLPVYLVLRCVHFVMNALRVWRKTEVFAKNRSLFWRDCYFCAFRCKHQFLSFFGGCKLLPEQILKRKLPERGFYFVLSNFVFQLAQFCTSNVQLITLVYQLSFWCRLKKQRYTLNDSSVYSGPCTVLELVAGPPNICTMIFMTVR